MLQIGKIALLAASIPMFTFLFVHPAAALLPLSPNLTLDRSAPRCLSARAAEPLVDRVGARRISWMCDTKRYDPYGDVETSERRRTDCAGAACDPWVDKAREVRIAYPASWTRSRAAHDLVISLHGTGKTDYSAQSNRTALETFLENWGRTSASVFQNGTVTATARSQALSELGARSGGRMILAALNSGYNDLERNLRWELFEPTVDPKQRPPLVSLSADRMEDVRRLLTFVRQLKRDNPGRIGKVYIVGFSNGAEAVTSLACFFPHEFDGFGMFDRRLTPSLYEFCGAVGRGRRFGPGSRLYQDMTVRLTALAGQPTVVPRSLRDAPRPIFLTGGTHSHAFTYDRGDLTVGARVVRASGIADCRSKPDSVSCQNAGWESDRLLDRIVIDDTAAPNNGATLGALARRLNRAAGQALFPATPADSDPAANLKRFLQLLAMRNHSYFSGASINPAVPNCGVVEAGVSCRRFADVTSVCTGPKSDLSLHRTQAGGNQRVDVVATAFVYTGGSAPLAYLEVTGGAHYTQGRGHVCAGPGTTHDADTGTQFLKFIKTFVPGGNL